ncbi:MAG: FKBP-type peptidyl-prolyl cis-trans isomerase, partial [Candidatus Thermoplasmatota archaeon]|nr:FKBP-type peptidyl-prolyl cis-trans isomerase [Candidatus Thermoplasmatota archaeon]
MSSSPNVKSIIMALILIFVATAPIFFSSVNNDSDDPIITKVDTVSNENQVKSRVDDRKVMPGDEPVVDYVGYFMNGQMFTTNVWRVDNRGVVPKSDYYYNYKPGTGRYQVTSGTIQGFRDAVLGMKVGDNKTVIIQPEQAYGRNNSHKLSDRTLMYFIFVVFIDIDDTTDTDGDGYGDDADYFPTSNSSYYQDLDYDGMPDPRTDPYAGGLDWFPDKGLEWRDFDADGIPDGQEPDIDGDGVLNVNDGMEYDATEVADTDRDAIGDNTDWDIDNDGYLNGQDELPYESTQWIDTDGDGYGDNQSGNDPDKFLTDPSAAVDTDGDGYPDNWNPGKTKEDSTTGITHTDAFPDDIAASLDTDSDGYPDNWNPGKSETDSSLGLSLDMFISDPAAHNDTDGDGYPDDWNPGKTVQDSTSIPKLSLDDFINDPAASKDTDGDE